jgi:hypothetical protein
MVTSLGDFWRDKRTGPFWFRCGSNHACAAVTRLDRRGQPGLS